MFDLKNELRLFARTEEHEDKGTISRTSSFLIDDQTLPPEQEALAVFQDLIVEKSRSFEIKGGRAYANETLADSLSAVFNELGSNQPQQIDSFLPLSNGDAVSALLLDEQLDLSEAARVRQAVQSLIADLERGGALRSRDQIENTFTWRDDAAREFRYIRQLQKHEEALIAELERNVALVNVLAPGPAQHDLGVDMEKRVRELREASESVTADAAAADQREFVERYRVVLLDAVSTRLGDLMKYGFQFESVAQGLGSWLHLVKPSSGDPRLSSSAPRGAVLSAFGESDTLENDVWAFVTPTTPSLSRPNRLALVHVIHTTGPLELETANRKNRWQAALAARAQGIPDFRISVEVLPLVTPAQPSGAEKILDGVQETAGWLAQLGLWARQETRYYESLPLETPALTYLLRAWKLSEELVFHINGSPLGKARPFGERDDLEINGTAVLSFSHIIKSGEIFADVARSCMLRGFDGTTGPSEQWSPLGKWLVQNDRLIFYADWENLMSWTAEDLVTLLKAGARVIIVKSGSLPPEFEEFGIFKDPILTGTQPPPPV